MRVMTWNIEWMNNWFVGGSQVAWKPDGGSIDKIQELAKRVAAVIRSVDPDVLTIQEGPSDIREMSLFADNLLTDNSGLPVYDIYGGLDGGAQKPYILIKAKGSLKDVVLASDDVTHSLFDEWEADIDADAGLELYDYTRDPLIVDAKLKDSGEPIRFITLHTKSKYVHNGQSMWNNPDTKLEFVQLALMARRRISAEAMHTRQYLDTVSKDMPTLHVVVTGDFNDGPGYDYFENHYLTHGVADILQGSLFRPHMQYRHVLVGSVPADEMYTAVFDDFIDDVDNRKLLLDHILVSPSLHTRHKDARVAHAEYDNEIDTSYPEGKRDRLPSDHRPILVEVE